MRLNNNESVNNSALWHEESSDEDCADTMESHSLSRWAKCNAGPKCYHCQKYGHYAFACPRKFRNRVVEGLDSGLVKPLLRGIKDHYVTQSAMASYLQAKPTVEQCIVLRYRMIKYHLGSIEDLVRYIEKNYDSGKPIGKPALKASAANPPAKTAISEARARPVLAEPKANRRGEKKMEKVSQVCKAITDIKLMEKKRKEEERNRIELEAQKKKLAERRSWELFVETFTTKIPIQKYRWVDEEYKREKRSYVPKWFKKLGGIVVKPSIPDYETKTHKVKEWYNDGYRTIPPKPQDWYLQWEVDANAIIDYIHSRHPNSDLQIKDLKPGKIRETALALSKFQVTPYLKELDDIPEELTNEQIDFHYD